MTGNTNPYFDFIKILDEEKTYRLLFPEREVGLAISIIFEKIENKEFEDEKFTENDLHDAFEFVSNTKERYRKEFYSGQIMELQEYFLDYDQESQKYYFKDYAYKFCKHAKETLKGAFNPTKIQKICSHLSSSLKDTQDLGFWLEGLFKKYEPELREQIDFLDRQILSSIEELKKDTSFAEFGFINVLIATEERLNQSQAHVQELRAAYAETRNIRLLLDQKDISESGVNVLILEVHAFIRYINDRLNSIDRKLDRIQPKIRKLFATLNKPLFSSKVEKFILYVLDNSTIVNKEIIFPGNLQCPHLHIATPDFTIIKRDKELFPAKPKERKIYVQNQRIINEKVRKIEGEIKEIEIIQNWENFVLSEIEARGSIKLSETFFDIIRETGSSQIAVTIVFNVIKYVYGNRNRLKLLTERSLQTNEHYKDITLWKMEIIKLS